MKQKKMDIMLLILFLYAEEHSTGIPGRGSESQLRGEVEEHGERPQEGDGGHEEGARGADAPAIRQV